MIVKHINNHKNLTLSFIKPENLLLSKRILVRVIVLQRVSLTWIVSETLQMTYYKIITTSQFDYGFKYYRFPKFA